MSKKIINKVVISILMLLTVLTMNNVANAVTVKTPVEVEKSYGATRYNMPQNSIAGKTGMFPQYYYSNGRQVTLDDNRQTYGIESWKAKINGAVVYCAQHGAYVRYGTYDSAKHYLIPNNTVIQGKSINVEDNTYIIKRQAESVASVMKGNQQAIIENNEVKYYTEEGEEKSSLETLNVEIDYDDVVEEGVGFIYSHVYEGGIIPPTDKDTYVGNVSKSYMEMMLTQLGGGILPSQYESSIDSSYTQPEITGIAGPEVVVMEQSARTSNGYNAKASYTYTSDSSNTFDIERAYIFSVAENAYSNNGQYASKYSLNDIQSAFWLTLKAQYPTIHKYPNNKVTANGIELYNKSLEYVNFVQNIKNNGYVTSIDQSQAQVIVDRENGNYIVGPFSVSYPQYNQDFSYVKSLSVTNGDKTVIYDELHSGLEIILQSGITDCNGTKKSYPKSGEKFFVKFSAEDLDYPTNIELNANFEYLSSATANVQDLQALANIYRYYGYCSTVEGSPYQMDLGTVTVRVSYKTKKEKRYKHEDSCTTPSRDNSCCNGYYIIENDTQTEKREFTVYQLYIKMGETPKNADAQELLIVHNAERNYQTVSKKVSMDLTMNMGGKVWEDLASGKETDYDGIQAQEEKEMPNVIVTLYNAETNMPIETKKTDSKGKYRFDNLNSMFQYYVKFTYNGQYYQPTIYSGPDTWGENNWKTNSNATDKRDERLGLNMRFEKIGSSPVNYKSTQNYNETFSKKELLGYVLKEDGKYQKEREAVIDEFGNLILENSSDPTTQKMIQYVKDCLIDAYTGINKQNSLDSSFEYALYPEPSLFLIDSYYKFDMRLKKSLLFNNGIAGISILYDNAYNINLGLGHRELADIAVKKDIEKVALEINGQRHEYFYDTLEKEPTADGTWEINIRLSEGYYNKNYSRELYKSDYLYKVSNYGANYQDYGKSKSDELEIYVTYEVMIRNQSTTIKTKIDELVDYYDKDYEYIDERSYIQIRTGDNKGIYDAKVSDTSRYKSISSSVETTINGYDKLYVQGLDDKYLTAGQTAYVYLTFKIKKDISDNESWVRLDEDLMTGTKIGVGKENIVEINGYSTIYAQGTKVPNVGEVGGLVAGIVDTDSKPGNLNPNDVPKDGTIKYEKFEDDTDKSPNLMIGIIRKDEVNRVISGVVWEDERTESIGATVTGDGKRQEKETLINGVTVQLVELMDNGTEYIWRTFENGSGTADKTAPIINAYDLVKDYEFAQEHDGAYAFKSFVPGKYVVRFIYGDTEKTVLTKDVNTTVNKTLGKTGLNDKSYNGQDFKSTTYQEGIEQNKMYSWRETSTWENGQEQLGNILTEIYTLKEDASNNETANAKLNELKAYLYDITASDKVNNASDAKDIESRRNEVINYSDNNVINHIAEVLSSYRDLPEYLGTSYNKTQVQSLIDELMYATNMRAETGVIVVEFEYDAMGTDGNNKDNTYIIQNVDLGLEERPKAQLAVNKEVANVKVTLADGSILFDAKSTASNVLWRDHKSYKVGYEGNFMHEDKFGSIVNIRNKNASKFGLVQLSMDEELMHGATMEIVYQVTVTNVGEVDYKDNNFYYRGNVSDTSKVVTTSANKVIDYVANNLQFNVSNNSAWKVISKDDILSQGLVNTQIANQLDKFNTIIVTEQLGAQLVPSLYKEKVNGNATDSTRVPLVLTQLITSENETDDLTYRNIVEIVETSNSVGRKNEYSVVGNQDPEAEPQELDSDRAEVVKILPPFGNAGIYIVIAVITIAAAGIVITGVIFIKKKVLRK